MMRVLSASEAVAPAYQRTKAILFKSFAWKRSFKIAAAGMLTLFGLLYMPNVPTMSYSQIPGMGHTFAMTMMIFSVLMSLIASVVTLALFYVAARMELVFFELVVTGQNTIAPMWRRYKNRVWRWIGLKMIPSAFVVVPFIALMLLFVKRMNMQQHAIQAGQMPNLHFFLQVFAFIIPIMLLCFTGQLISALLSDFAMPSIALEDAPAGVALQRFGAAFRDDPGGMAFFILIKIILFIGISIASYILFFLALIPPGLIFVAGAFLCKVLLAHAGIAGSIVEFLATTLAILAGLAYMICVYLAMIGTVVLFFQSHAIYFFGGRYPLLGDLLEPPPPAYEPPLPEPTI